VTPKNQGIDQDNESNENVVKLLDEKEDLEFDPTVKPTTWTPSQAMISFLKKRFNQCLADNEKEAILSDFPNPNIPVLEAPKLDEEVKEQIKSKGKDPHFGQEKVLFKLQESLLDVSGPLMCLWVDLNNSEAKVSPYEILLLI